MYKKIFFSTVLSCSLFSSLSYAEDYTILSPGSEQDSIGLISKYLSESLAEVSKQTFDVKYINFGSPQETYKQAFNSTPAQAKQRLTLILSPRFLSFIVSHRSLYTLESFYYYNSIFSSQYVLVTKNDGYIKKFSDIQSFCKQYPLNISISGIGDTGYLAFNKINKKYKCEIQYIPDKRYKKQIRTIKTTNANIGIIPLYELLPVLKAQKDPYVSTNIIPLAVLGNTSIPQLPNVPTTQSLGFNNVYATSSMYIAGLASVAKSDSHIMQEYINNALNNPIFVAHLKELGITLKQSSSNAVYNDLKQQLSVVSNYYKQKPW